MSSRRSRCRQTGSLKISDDQIADLIYKLQQLIPHHQLHTTTSTSTHHKDDEEVEGGAKVLEETCSYIRRLQREAQELSERLSELLQSKDTTPPQAAIITNLILH